MTALLVIAAWSALAGGVCAAVSWAAIDEDEIKFVGGGQVEKFKPGARRAIAWAGFCAGTLGTSVVLALCWYVLLPLIRAGWQLIASSGLL
jgi:hypothetical protein